ncbi:hypothetical protein OPS25_06080 [Alteromonas ponticola]|uniref:Sulfotransferase family protein n=1 Tax=Alteromonas aquimaris TaxID=2998417 RepID=A0ABT3P5L9_9ALTE|nr:hypothetical protein [Alteromonas aquimaris]MCW8108062.1 hypothetical protein [Alteromonas aquimaris]
MQLILHIGTHKTGTTTIQQQLSAQRQWLKEQGCWYPSYKELFPDVDNHYSHLDLAKGLMGQSKKFTVEQVEEYFFRLHQIALQNGYQKVLISAEAFYRAALGNNEGSIWDRKENYIKKLRSIIKFDDVRVVLVLRPYASYLESLYSEHVKVTAYKGDILRFLREYPDRFCHDKQCELWSKHIGEVDVLYFEDLIERGNVTANFLHALGISAFPVNEEKKRANVALPPPLIEMKRLFNQVEQDRGILNKYAKMLAQVAKLDKFTARFEGAKSFFDVAEQEKVIQKILSEDSISTGSGFVDKERLTKVNNKKLKFEGLSQRDVALISSLLLSL